MVDSGCSLGSSKTIYITIDEYDKLILSLISDLEKAQKAKEIITGHKHNNYGCFSIVRKLYLNSLIV